MIHALKSPDKVCVSVCVCVWRGGGGGDAKRRVNNFVLYGPYVNVDCSLLLTYSIPSAATFVVC